MGRLVPVDLQKHFDAIAPAYYEIVDRVWYDVGYYHARESEFLRKRVVPGKQLVIDAGCGPGRHTSFLGGVFHRVIAIDISRKMLESAAATVPAESRIDFVQADIRYLPFRSGIADLIVNMEVLEHLPARGADILAAFQEFRRVLKQDGGLITEAPLRRHALWRSLGIGPPSWKEISPSMRNRYYQINPLTVWNLFNNEEVESLLHSAGFQFVARSFVRILPAGLIEGRPFLTLVDSVLEKVPLLNRLAREAIWEMRPESCESRAEQDIASRKIRLIPE